VTIITNNKECDSVGERDHAIKNLITWEEMPNAIMQTAGNFCIAELASTGFEFEATRNRYPCCRRTENFVFSDKTTRRFIE
jgi:hypothetical protein